MVESCTPLKVVQIELEYFNEDTYELSTACSVKLTRKGNALAFITDDRLQD